MFAWLADSDQFDMHAKHGSGRAKDQRYTVGSSVARPLPCLVVQTGGMAPWSLLLLLLLPLEIDFCVASRCVAAMTQCRG